MKLLSDWHIHSNNSCDAAWLPLRDIVASAARRGMRHAGVSDHLHTPHNLPDIEASRRDFDAAAAPAWFHFGIETSCVSEWEIAEIARGRGGDLTYGIRQGGQPGCAMAIGIGAGDLGRLGIEYVIGGAHWPLYVPFEREKIIRDYHRQNMFLAIHPLVDIVAHPWWWHGHWADADGGFRGDPWLDDFRKIPDSMHDEFGAACRESDAKVEINIEAMLCNEGYPERFRHQYVEYLARLKADGTALCLGSDCHSAYTDIKFENAEAMLAKVGIRDEDLWVLPPRQTRPPNKNDCQTSADRL